MGDGGWAKVGEGGRRWAKLGRWRRVEVGVEDKIRQRLKVAGAGVSWGNIEQ